MELMFHRIAGKLEEKPISYFGVLHSRNGPSILSVSDNGFVSGAVINGSIRDEIGLNYEIGAMGPYALANTTIGRAWNLLSINGGNCGKVETTYMGTVGNPMNLINIIIAENERESPFEPVFWEPVASYNRSDPQYGW
jgi:hypothetical protein